MGSRRSAGRGRRDTGGSRSGGGRSGGSRSGSRRGGRGGGGNNNAVMIVGGILAVVAVVVVAMIAMGGEDETPVKQPETYDTGDTGKGSRSANDTGFGGSSGNFKRLDSAPWSDIAPLLVQVETNRKAALSARNKGEEKKFENLMNEAWKAFRAAEKKVDDWQYEVGEDAWDQSFGKTYGQKMHRMMKNMRGYLALEK